MHDIMIYVCIYVLVMDGIRMCVLYVWLLSMVYRGRQGGRQRKTRGKEKKIDRYILTSSKAKIGPSRRQAVYKKIGCILLFNHQK